MNNDSNNNVFGNILGSVTNDVDNKITDENIEMLDFEVSSAVQTESQNVERPIENSQPERVEPLPAYTNPQTITPMQEFNNQNSIGMTPPVSLQPEKKQKKPMNKVLFVILILVLLAGVGFGVWYILNRFNQNPEVKIATKDLNINVGDTLSSVIGVYAVISGTDARNCVLDTSLVDINKEGSYDYKITCGNVSKTGKITVNDNRELEVETVTVYKTNKDTLEAKEFAKNTNDGLTYEFVNANDATEMLQKAPGIYKLKIKVSDGSKTKEVDVNLVLTEYNIKGYLICSNKEENVLDNKATMIVSEKFAIVDNNNAFGNIAYKINTFKFKDESEYTSYLASYNTNHFVTINEITGETEFDDTNLTITITNNSEVEKLKTEYGAKNLEKYSSIKSYFEVTKKQTCSYKTK